MNGLRVPCSRRREPRLCLIVGAWRETPIRGAWRETPIRGRKNISPCAGLCACRPLPHGQAYVVANCTSTRYLVFVRRRRGVCMPVQKSRTFFYIPRFQKACVAIYVLGLFHRLLRACASCSDAYLNALSSRFLTQ